MSLSSSAEPAPISAALSEFQPEWVAVVVVLLIDAAWARRIGFSLSISPLDAEVLLIMFGPAVALRALLPQSRAALSAEFFAVSVGATTAFGILSYLCCAVAMPLVDERLLQLDRALGFDWLHWFRFVTAHPAAASVLHYSYNSLVYQGLYAAIFFGLMGRKERVRELFWIIFLAGLLTSAGSVFFPALGAFDAFRMPQLSDYIPAMEQLRAGIDLHFDLGQLTGVVTFPSFHTTMALVYAWGFRRTGAVGYVLLALNTLMVLATPFYGGHYLVDMIAGAAVAVVSVAGVRFLLARRLGQNLRAAA